MASKNVSHNPARSAPATPRELRDRARNLTEAQLSYVLWASVNPEWRQPRTLKAFAETVGVSVSLCHRWAKDPRIVDAIRTVVIANAGDPSKISGVLDFLHETTMNQDAQLKNRLTAAKMWLETVGVTGLWRREQDIAYSTTQQFDLESMTDEEIEALYADHPDRDAISVGTDVDGNPITLGDIGGTNDIETTEPA